MSQNPQYKVTASSLNLRSEPQVRPGNRLVSLPNGHTVTKLAVASDPAWWQVSTSVDGTPVTGFVARQYLQPVSSFTQAATVSGITAVHLRENWASVTRNNLQRAYPLGEPGRPRRQGATPQALAASLHNIINWLGVDARARYAPNSTSTYCNIYAHDYCYLAGVYIPRVWWTRSAIQRLAQGGAVAPQYGVTVSELNANSLYNWFVEYGTHFGWQRTFDLNQLQNAANQGGIGIIVAQRSNLNYSGHITAVVPETGQRQALRNAAGVTRPLQSQAGRSNFKYGMLPSSWWVGPGFAHHGFWTHA